MRKLLAIFALIITAAILFAAGCGSNSILGNNGAVSVSGRVETPGGNPLSSAIVTLDQVPCTPEDAATVFAGAGNSKSVSVLTASDGSFAFETQTPGSYSVRVRKDGLISGQGLATTDCVIKVAASTLVAGNILVPATSGSITEPPVAYFEGTSIGTLASEGADKVWSFNMTDVPAGEYELIVAAKGFETVRKHVKIDASAGAFEIEPVLLKGNRI
jgi:hypothetical protein